ncbi:MAG: hypothetical protein GX767_07175 [Firmicutes bacterium]|nr:hypothetical protein [Bacillota bacterium]
MKIAISANGKNLSSRLDPRFGRCSYYALYDTEGKNWNFIANPGALEGSGAGVKAAQFLLEQKIDVLLTGDVGPNATKVLKSAGIKVFSLSDVSLEDALKQYEQGQAKHLEGATVASHAGMGEPVSQNLSFDVIRVAIATDGDLVAQHFGRCPSYTLVDIKNNNIVSKNVIDNPGHQPGFLPRFLADKEVACIIAGGMGPRAQNLFAEQGINVILGVTGLVEEAIASYLKGELAGGESLCEHEEGHGHECGGH